MGGEGAGEVAEEQADVSSSWEHTEEQHSWHPVWGEKEDSRDRDKGGCLG